MSAEAPKTSKKILTKKQKTMKKEKKFKKILSFNVPEELYLKLSEQARVEERPVSQIVRRILSKNLETKKNENK